MFDLPQPFGPDDHADARREDERVRSGKDLKPLIVIELRCMLQRLLGSLARSDADGIRRRGVPRLEAARAPRSAAACSAAFFERPEPLPDDLAVDARRDLEDAVVRGARLAVTS